MFRCFNDAFHLFWFSKIKTVLVIWLLFMSYFSGAVHAQNDALGSWNILHFRYSQNQNLLFFGEAQLRSLGFYNQYHYHEWKVGVLHQFQPNFNAGIAFGKYDTYAEGGNFVVPKRSDEWRLWPQIILSQKIKKCHIEHRYRGEFRWFPSDFRMRFRYRLLLSYTLAKTKSGQSFKMEGGNELFFGTRAPYFERNRSHIGFSFPLTPYLRTQIGYLHQFDFQIFDETGRDFLQVGLYFHFKKPEKPKP